MIKFLKRLKFTLNPTDVVERISRGSGPGGQKVNKSMNCVNLLHTPTKISVKVHDSRDLDMNKHIAWKRLTEKVEYHLQPHDSKIGRRIEKLKKRKAKQRKRSLEKYGKPVPEPPLPDPITP